MTDLLRIVAPPVGARRGFVAGVIVRAGRVVEAAPIVGWMRGRPTGYVRQYARGRGWQTEWVG